METHLYLENIKCGGCAATIKKTVKKFPGVSEAIVNTDDETIIISHPYPINIPEIKKALKQIGYPEKGSTEGVEKLVTNIKSYVSCTIGKMNQK